MKEQKISSSPCSTCGFENPPGMRFCGQCGAENPPGFKFCGTCGKPLGETEQPPGRPAVAEPALPVGQNPEGPTEVVEEVPRKPATSEEPLENRIKVAEKAPAAVAELAVLICPACGFENPAREKYCSQCGQPLIGKAKPSPEKRLEEMIEIVEAGTPATPPPDESIEIVDEEPAEVAESPTTEQSPSILTCKMCGTDNRPGIVYCGLCGAVVAPTGAPCPDCGTLNMPGDLFCSKCTRRLGVE